LKLSVIIITKNEARNLPKALASVSFADEVIVVDSGSTDQTVQIAKDAGAKVFITDHWPGYGPQKNHALSMATGDWVLSLDADEWLTPELINFIQSLLRGSRVQSVASGSDAVAAYRLRRRSYFIDRLIRWGDWRRDRVVRLFLRGRARFSDASVHEQLLVQGGVAVAVGVLMHHPFRTIQEVAHKMHVYNGLAADRLVARGRGGSYEAWARASFTFFRGFVLKLGFLDGFRGLQLAWFNARGTWLRYFFAGEQLAKRKWQVGEQRQWDRFKDWQNLLLTDHGILRLIYKNRFRLPGGLFRSNQPSPNDVVYMVKRYGVRTVVNLRGENSQQGWFRLEVHACSNAGLERQDAVVYSRGLLETPEIENLQRLIQTIELPALVHCKSGADRAGFFSVLYRHYRLGEPIERALAELSPKFGHFPHGPTGVLDHFFRTYLKSRQNRESLTVWLRNSYNRSALQTSFHPSRFHTWLTDRLLRRE
jgi:glycosyltransferase involved in cell wall biosynthesis